MQFEHSVASIHRIKKNVHRCVIASSICERAFMDKVWQVYFERSANATARHCFYQGVKLIFQVMVYIWARPWENVSYAICEQQRRSSVWAFAQSNQSLCCSLPRQNDTSSSYIRNFKILCSWAGQFVSCLVGDSQRHIFHGVAHISLSLSLSLSLSSCTSVHLSVHLSLVSLVMSCFYAVYIYFHQFCFLSGCQSTISASACVRVRVCVLSNYIWLSICYFWTELLFIF